MNFEEVVKIIEYDYNSHGEFDVAELLSLAKDGDDKAQYKLGQMYAFGQGRVKINLIIAYMWFDISSINGNWHGAAARDILAKKNKIDERQTGQALGFALDWIKKYQKLPVKNNPQDNP